MTVSRRGASHPIFLAVCGVLTLLLVGCGGGDGVEAYKVAKSTDSGSSKDPSIAGGDYRILGAMYPASDPEWFFKLAGPADDLTAYEAGFDQLLASVSLPPGGGPPDFTAPDGWKRAPGRGQIVVATVKTPDGKYEVTITSSRGGVQENLRRWAVDQLGQASFEADDVPKHTRTVEAKGVKGLRVDLRGPKNPTPPRGGPMRAK